MDGCEPLVRTEEGSEKVGGAEVVVGSKALRRSCPFLEKAKSASGGMSLSCRWSVGVELLG